MILPVALVVKVSVLFAAAWLAAAAARRGSAAVRHQMWAAAVVCSLALPLLVWVTPRWGSTDFAIPAAASPVTVVRVIAQRAPAWDAQRVLLWIWAAGAALLLLRLIAGLAQLFLTGSRARRRDLAALDGALPPSVRLLESSDRRAMPLTWGLFRPKILLPASAAEWPESRLRIVLAHELAHIARRDWILRICGELARALYWFHPLAWIAAAKMREESERACDDAVLAAGVGAADYAAQLVAVARALDKPARAWSAALAMARPSNFERRLTVMLNPSVNRRSPSGVFRALTMLASLCVLLPLAGLRAPGQGLAGTLSGTVVDPTGAVVPRATVTLSGNTLGTRDATTSDASGRFQFSNLPAGQYELKVMVPGFAAATVPVNLEAGRDSSAKVNLIVGQTKEVVTVSAPGTPRAQLAAPTSGRLRVGGMVQPAILVNRVSPVYPPSAQAAGIQGTVEFEAVIGKDGTVGMLRAVSGSADPALVTAATNAVSQWRYSPARLNGEPIQTLTQISIQFTLSQ